jgi:hypothetical protein
VAARATWGRSYGEQYNAPHPVQTPPVSHPPSLVEKRTMKVSEKAWPKFDGTGDLGSFLSKMEYLMHITDMPHCERAPQLVQLLKGRAFTWLQHLPNWIGLQYDEIVTALQKEYGAMKTRDLARLENLKCGNDITKFNDEFNKIGQGCRDILSEDA